MRAILCVRPGGPARADGWMPWARGARAAAATGLSAAAHLEVAPDGALVWDLRGAPTWDATAATAREVLHQLQAGTAGPPPPAGLAAGRFPAACAARLAAPGELRVLAPGSEAAALAPLPLDLLPALPAGLARDLHTLRIFTLGELAACPPTLLQAVFGPAVLPLQALACGATRGSPPAATAERARWAAWCRIPAPPLAPEHLGALLAATAADLAARLQAEGRAALTLAVGAGFPGGPPVWQSRRLAEPLAEAAGLQAVAAPLLGRVLRARRRHPLWLGIAAPRTGAAVYQEALPLPPPPEERAARLQEAITQIQQQFGAHVIRQGLVSHGLYTPAHP